MVSPAAMARRLTLQVWGMEPQQVARRVWGEPVGDHQRVLSLACSIGARLANLPWQCRHLSVQVATGGFSKFAKR